MFPITVLPTLLYLPFNFLEAYFEAILDLTISHLEVSFFSFFTIR